MITYINNENKQDYTVLFDKASAKLGLVPVEKEVGLEADGTPIIKQYKYVESNGEWSLIECVPFNKEEGADNSNADFDASGNFLITKNGQKVISKGISSLNEYFQHITQLAALATNNGRTGTDPYFLRLPLDEPFFEINANTRGITVPGELSQIGIVGDKLAEVLFFKIDRYYDAIDLNTRHIYIEWELPDGTKGISRDYLRDVQSEKDKIIFGWLIDDDLTAQVGTIRFAVRFVEWSNRQDQSNEIPDSTGLEYSFSSLPATVTISDSLHYTLFEDDEALAYYTTTDTDTAVYNYKFYLEDSEPDAVDETAPQLAAIPVYVRNLDKVNNEDAELVAPAVVEDGTITKQAIYKHNLIGGGKGQEEGSLELVAEAYSPDSGNITYMFGYKATETSGTDGLVTKTKFMPVSDTSDEATTYYKKGENGAYVPVAHSQIDASTQYYERVAYTIVDKAGYYFVNTRNRVAGKKTNTADSFTLYVPYAAMPEVTTPMADHFVISEQAYSTAPDESVDQTKRTDEDKSNIKVVVGEAGAASTVLRPIVVADDGTGTENFTYIWYKSADIYDTAMEHAEVIEGADAATLEVSQPGCYALKIDNQFNNDHTETELLDAGVCRVTRMPEIPNLAETWAHFEEILIAGRENQPALEIPEVDHDVMHYEWHKVTADNADEDPIATDDLTSAAGDLEFTNGVATIPFIPQTEGYYYFLLSNTLNGATAIMNSANSYGVISVRRA